MDAQHRGCHGEAFRDNRRDTYAMDADRLPVDLLPYLAWALSVDRWDKDWPAERKIAVIQRSYWLHRRKGTRAVRVIEDMGFSPRSPSGSTSETSRTFRLEVDVNEIGLTPKRWMN